MWWGGGGSKDPAKEGDPTSPIAITGRRRRPSNDSSPSSSPLSSSLASSYGSPTGDLAEIRDLKNNFSNQEQLLGQLRDVLQSNNQRLQSKEKEDYASRLAQMRNNRKGGAVPKMTQSVDQMTQEEDLTAGGKKSRGARMQMLRKQLEESKARQEAELSSRQDLENIVAGLQRELDERDSMIQNMQLGSVSGSVTSSVLGSPFVMSPDQLSPTDSPGNTTPPAGYSEGYGSSSSFYDLKELVSAKDNKILEQNEQIAHFNRKVWDLEESLKEKDEVISARTQAVGLASASLAAKGKDTLDQLEDTRQELRSLQENWSQEQGEWRKEREETRILLEGANARVESLQESNKRLERSREEVGSKNQELRELVGRLEEEFSALKSRSREDKILLEAKVEEIEEERNAMEDKIAKKEEILEKRIETMQSRSSKIVVRGEEGERIAELENALAEAEEERGSLQLKLVDLEEMAAAELKLKARVKDAEENSRRVGDELDSQRRAASMAESEKIDLMEAVATRDTEIEALQMEISKLVSGREELARGRLELEIRCVQLEEERDRWEGEKLEFIQQIEDIKAKSVADLLPLEELKIKHSELAAEHDKFGKEHAAAMERSKLYDKDMLDKSRKIKEQSIDLKTLENLLHEKTKEISYQLSEVDLREKELIKAKETIVNFENVISKKESELTELKNILDESEEHTKLIDMKQRIDELEKDLTILIEDKNSLEQDIECKNNQIEDLQQGFEQEKEELNCLLEQNNFEKVSVEESNKEMLRRIQELEETIESKSIEIEEQKQKLEASLEDNKQISSSRDSMNERLEEVQLKLDSSEAALEEQNSKVVELQNLLETKTIEFEKGNRLNEEVDIKLEAYINEIKSLKQSVSEHEESVSMKVTELEKLAHDLIDKNERIKSLESDLEIKSEEIQTMNEEVMSKYKIIEELQSQMSSLEQSNDQEGELKSTNDNMMAEMMDLKNKSEHQTEELISKSSALERLQTVFDVCEEQSKNTTEEVARKETEILNLKKEIELLKAEKPIDNVDETMKLNMQLEEMSITLTSLQQMKESYEEKIRTLENENMSLEELSTDIAEYRRQILGKDVEIDSLKEKLEAKILELSKKDVEIFDDKQAKIGKLFEKHDIEQVEMLQLQLKEKDQFYEKQKAEMAEKHKMQLEEKQEFLQSSMSDDMLKINALLELKSQETEGLRTANSNLEDEKIKLESRMAEIEQFRQEVAKEANQHMEETGDKMRELKTQFENKQEEVNQLILEKEASDINLTKTAEELKSFQTKYNDLLANSSNADLIAEKHLLKEKNEKLTNMCKKYLAKVKQQEAILKEKEGMVENDQIEEFNTKISNFEIEIKQAKSENEILMDEMTSKYQIIDDLQSQIGQKEAECENWERECSDKENKLIQKEIEKDDIIRKLKQKLEEAPEDISIPVNVAEASLAHEKTKTELLNLREKCKKLIVKVKQQDAHIKRKARESTSSEASFIANEDTEAVSKDNEKLKKENEELKKSQEEISSSSSYEIEKLKKDIENLKEGYEQQNSSIDIEKIMEENKQIKKGNEDLLCKSETNEASLKEKYAKLEEKLETVKKERSSLNEDQVTLKETIKELNISNQNLMTRAEEAVNELKRVREANIVNQMAASPLLSEDKEAAFGVDGDDGWGSPEPEVEKLHVEPETESDGWGGWGATDNDEDKSPDEEDGLKDNSEAKKEDAASNEGWGGWDEEMATPSPVQADQEPNSDPIPAAFPDGPRNDSGHLIEREADIEDGWGDDSWGGFGGDNPQGNSVLAANLRIEEKDDDGLADMARGSDSEIARTGSAGPCRSRDDSPMNQALQLQGKIAEKESVIESMENELKNVQQKLGMIEDELLTVQEEKDEIGKQFTNVKKLKTKQDAENENLKEKVMELSTEIQKIEILRKEAEQSKVEKMMIEEKLNENSEEKEKMEKKIKSLEEASQDMEGLLGVEERYKDCLRTISNLEEQNIQADMNSEENETSMKADIDKKQLQITSLETEIKNLNEQLETSENRLTDLSETVGHLSERRNSLDTSVSDLQATVSTQKEEIETYKVKVAEMEMQGDRTDEVSHLNNEIEQLTDQVKSKNEESEQLSMLRDNLFSEIATLKANYNEQIELNKQQCENLSSSESRLNSLQLELHQSAVLAEEDQQKMLNSKLGLEKELNSLRSMVMDVTSENETLQTELASAQNQISANEDRINQLQSDLNAASRPAIQHPPPDITNNGQQPDVAARNVNPDIMRGPINPGPDIMQGQGNVNPDIMGGAQPLQQPLDLVQEQHQGWGWGGNNNAAEAAGWFDDFEVEPAQYQLPEVEQVQAEVQQAHNNNREQELEQIISAQTTTILQNENTIHQLQTRVEQLDMSMRQHEETIQQNSSRLEQYRSSDENNLKAIEQLETTIWQVTDEKQQMSLVKDNIETEIREMVTEIEQLRSQAAESKNECERLRSELAQANTQSTHEAELARQYEQLQTAQTSLEQLTNDYRNIMSELEETKSKNAKLEEQVITSPETSDSVVSEMTVTAPVAISEHVETTEHHYQSPPPAVFNWNTAAEVKEENASSFFAAPQVQDQSAASFFEDIGAQSAIPQVDNFFEGIDTPQPTAPSNQVPVYHQEPQPNSPHSNSYNELRNLQDQLRMKVVHSEQLSTDLGDLKHQLEVKQSEAENLQKALEQTRQEKEQQISVLQANLHSIQSNSSENESLKEQVVSLTDSMSICNKTIENLQEQLLKVKEEHGEDVSKEATSVTVASPIGEETSASASLVGQEQKPSTASLFGQEQIQSTSSLFEQDQVSSTASLFGQEATASTASLFQEVTPSTASLFGQEQTTECVAEDATNPLPSVDQLKKDEMLANLTWYQTELAQYQQACADWQVWGDTKSQEINELNENLCFQMEAFGIKKSENEKLLSQIQKQDNNGQNNDVQNMLKLKELEVLDLKETVERLESEKQELSEEIDEMRNTIDELRRISDNVESYKDDSELLVDTKNNLEELEKERAKLISELTDLRNEMATISFSNDKKIKDLRNEMEEKNQEILNLNGKELEANEKVQELEKSLVEEKKMQEEIGDEYEGMQIQVQESSSRITELLKEIDSLKMESESKINQVEKSIEESKDNEGNLESMEVQSSNVSEVEELKQKVAEISTELDQYKQTCLDWNAWSEGKTLEYNQLLEAYNQYVEAYNNMKVEFDSVLEQSVKGAEATDENESNEKELLENKLVIKQLRAEVESKEKELAFSTVEKDGEIEELKLSIENKSKELEDLLGVEERYNTSLTNISDLEQQMIQADMNAEVTETKLKVEIEEKRTSITNLQQEVESLTEKMTAQTTTQDDALLAQLREELDVKVKEIEGKSLEYNTLLEAYNQYVEAYNNMKVEFDSVLEQTVKGAEVTGEKECTEKELLENKLILEQLRAEVESKEKELAFSTVEQDGEIEELKLSIENKSKELEDLLGVEERYKTSLTNISDLEQQMIQADMNAEVTETKLKAEIEEKQTSITNLQQEVESLTEKMTAQTTTQDDAHLAQLREELDVKVKEIEGKSLEYNTLLEAYNQYVVAYDHLNNEFANLQSQPKASSSSENASEREQELNEKNKSIEELQKLLSEKDEQMKDLKQQVESKEKELVEKTCAVAKLSIGSALSSQLSKSLQVIKQTSTEVKPVEKVLEISNQTSENIAPDESMVLNTSEEAEAPWEESEGWGVEAAEVQQSSSSEVLLLETEISELRQKIRNLEDDKSKCVEDLNSAKLKNGKFLVKVKQLTKVIETLKKNKSAPAELDDLDRALQDEMKHQAEKSQNELKESRKELDSLKLEKENLSKKLDTLETANERLIEMKEKQDNEVEFLQHKNKGLENQIDGLNWNITELEERRETEVSELNNKLSVFTSQENDNLDSNQLKMEIATLTSQLTEANRESDRLRADLTAINEALVLAQGETATVKSQIIDLQDSIDRLVNEKENLKSENESLKDGVSVTGSEGFDEIQKLNETLNSEIASLKHYIENQNLYSNPPLSSTPQETSEVDHLKSQLIREQKLVLQLEQDLQAKESSLELLENELMSARDQKSQHEFEFRSQLESPRESIDREVFSAFSDNDLVSENLRLKADLDSSMREKRQMAGCIQNWTEELNRDDIGSLGEEGLREELSIAIRTLQIKDHKCEEVTQENIRLIEERDTLMLKLSTVMRQLEGSRTTSAMSSMAGSRTTTPVPGGMPTLMPHFDPHAEIRGLHAKLEELRRLNYSLDVELQRERGDRVSMGQRVMAPRSRHASQMLQESKKSESPEKVQHI